MNRTHSHLVDMFSIGKSYEGRHLYVLQVEEKLKETFTKNDTQRQKYTFQTDRPWVSCVLSDRKEKPTSEEGRVDRLRGPCSGVDRACILSVVCQRGNIKLSFFKLALLFVVCVSVSSGALEDVWSLGSSRKTLTSVHLSHLIIHFIV